MCQHLMTGLRQSTHPPHSLHIQDFTYLLWYSVLSSVLVTCSLLCGFLISLWGVWRVMECGHLCVLMSALVYRTAGEKLLTSFMKGILHVYAQLPAYSDPMPDRRVALWWWFWMKGCFQSICMCCPFPKPKNVLTSEINFVHWASWNAHSFFTCSTPSQLWGTRKVPPTNQSSKTVVRNHGSTDRNRHSIHVIQRCLQQKE